jgi:hypothetical protein
VHLGGRDSVKTILGFGHHDHVGLGIKQGAQPSANNAVVVGQEDADSMIGAFRHERYTFDFPRAEPGGRTGAE